MAVNSIPMKRTVGKKTSQLSSHFPMSFPLGIVIPAKAGIQSTSRHHALFLLDPLLRGDDRSLRWDDTVHTAYFRCKPFLPSEAFPRRRESSNCHFEILPVYYEVTDLESARCFLKQYNKPVILTNITGSTRYYGMLVLDYMFKRLIAEFPQVTQVVVNVGDDNAALFTAHKLGYFTDLDRRYRCKD